MSPASTTTTASGYLLVLAVMWPVAGILLSFVVRGRHVERVAWIVLPVGFVIAGAALIAVAEGGHSQIYIVGNWAPPLGIALRADGISAAMMMTTAIVMSATGVYAHGEFSQSAGGPEERAPVVFWVLLFAIWSALNALVLGSDLFNLYVALELLTFAAVPLVCLKGQKETVEAALRYMLFALIGSVLYLLGAAMIYGAYGTLDMGLLSERVRAEAATLIAASLMTVGLLAKTALFPLHLWLPPAHAGAPAPGSAMLSALVVKGSFFVIVRIWFDAMPGLLSFGAAQVLGSLGAAAIIVGSVVALRQQRLKLMIAYSTIAQIGYLFLMFPLAAGFAAGIASSDVAWTGGWLQLFSHAFAKAAIFMAAGLIAEAIGHDRMAELGGIGRRLPITMLAFSLSGLSLVGIPPSGGFAAKWLLLLATVMEGQWWWAVVIGIGGLLAGGYIFVVMGKLLASPPNPILLQAPVSRRREIAALSLAICAVLLGLVPLQSSELLQIGR